MHVTVTGLNVYPVKSCRGIACDRVDVTPQGLAIRGVRDREWMVVDARGRFVTQREQPRMAMIETAAVDGRLMLKVPGLDPVMPDVDGDSREVVVWNAHVRGHDGGDAIANALSAYLSQVVRLVRFDDARPRLVNPDYAGATGATTLYADGYPVLVIGQASLDELNERLGERGAPDLPMNRFRPNVVIDGLDAYAEDHVDTIRNGDVELTLVKPCTRCEVTTTDQDTGRRSREPLQTLSTYRRDDRLAGVTFGMNATVTQGAGSAIVVGDTAEASFRF